MALDLKQDLTQKPVIYVLHTENKKGRRFPCRFARTGRNDFDPYSSYGYFEKYLDLAEDLDGISETSFDDEFDKMTFG